MRNVISRDEWKQKSQHWAGYLMENAKFEMVLSENNVSRDDHAHNNDLLQQQN